MCSYLADSGKPMEAFYFSITDLQNLVTRLKTIFHVKKLVCGTDVQAQLIPNGFEIGSMFFDYR